MFENGSVYHVSRFCKNAFAEKLAPFKFDPYSMLVVDLMHEFELGVWKSTFIHIIRVLFAAVPGGHAVAELNARYVYPYRLYYYISLICQGSDKFLHLAEALFDDSLTMYLR